MNLCYLKMNLFSGLPYFIALLTQIVILADTRMQHNCRKVESLPGFLELEYISWKKQISIDYTILRIFMSRQSNVMSETSIRHGPGSESESHYHSPESCSGIL